MAVVDGVKNGKGEFITDAKGKKTSGTPPRELVLAWRCKEWKTLPKAGGYYDQPYTLMNRMSYLHNIYTALTSFRERKGKAIHQTPDAERRIIGLLRKLRYI